jgi:hypothetical protein
MVRVNSGIGSHTPCFSLDSASEVRILSNQSFLTAKNYICLEQPYEACGCCVECIHNTIWWSPLSDRITRHPPERGDKVLSTLKG